MPRLIKTKEDYQAALAEIERLMEINPEPDSQEGLDLELLSVLVSNYESNAFPITISDPIDAVEFRMEQQNLTPRDLIPFLGSRSKVSEVLARKRPLTLSMIRALHDGLGIPAKSLIAKPALQPESDNIDWNRFPIKEMIERGWIDATVKALQAFVDALPVGLQTAVLYRKSANIRSARGMDHYSLLAWTARVSKVASKMECTGEYRFGSVTLDFMRKVCRFSQLDSGPKKAQEFLLKHGIRLVIEPHLPYTYLDGAAILIDKDRPIIGMSLRHDRLDNFWFTLMHELAHVSLHSEEGVLEFIDDLDVDADRDEYEMEADRLAGEALIPSQIWLNTPLRNAHTPHAAQSLAKKIGVHPAIVAGRMRHESNSFRQLNNLVGHHEVRKQFPDITWLN